ncbi:MAG: DNA-binding protein, partial [Methyloversatilis sp. 12-65-5]
TAVDEPLDATQCGGKENCLDEHRCMTHDLWSSLSRHMYDYLDSVNLHELMVQQRDKTTHRVVVHDHLARPGVSEMVRVQL